MAISLWSDDDLLKSKSEIDEPEVANLCQMTNSDSNQEPDEVNDSPITYDELSHTFDTLVED